MFKVRQMCTTRFIIYTRLPCSYLFLVKFFVTAMMTKEGLIDEWSITPLCSECKQECLSSVANLLPLCRLDTNENTLLSHLIH